MGESPRWRDGRFWFSDWGARQIVAIDADGNREPIVAATSFPFSFDSLPSGQLLIALGGEGRLVRMESDGSLVTHAELSGLSDHPWKDIVVDGRGNAYVGNVGFDFPTGEYAPGILALITPEGRVRPVADGIAFPHGMVVTPDNSTLIVAEAYGNELTAFDIAGDGSLSGRRVWADLDGGVPHGICLDTEGAVWYADIPYRRCVRVREGGEVLDTIGLDRGCFACMLGGVDRRMLFMMTAEWSTAGDVPGGEARSGRILAVEAPAPGVGWP